LKHEKRRHRKRELQPAEYHHQPSQAASSFSRTATAERFSKKETHKFSRSLVDHLNTKRCIRPSGYAQVSVSEDAYIIPPERSPQGNRPVSPRQRQFRSSLENNGTSRFSEAILQNNSNRNAVVQDLSVLRAARNDWSESDEQSSTSRRTLSMSSIRRKKSVEIPYICASNPTRIGDDESVYRGRTFCLF